MSMTSDCATAFAAYTSGQAFSAAHPAEAGNISHLGMPHDDQGRALFVGYSDTDHELNMAPIDG